MVSFFWCHEQVIYNQIPIYFDQYKYWAQFTINLPIERFIANSLFSVVKFNHMYLLLRFWTSKLLKFDFFLLRTEDQAFILIFVRKKTEFLTIKHWLSWLNVTQKLRKTILKKVNKIQIAGCSELQYMGIAFIPQRKLYYFSNYIWLFSNCFLSPI